MPNIQSDEYLKKLAEKIKEKRITKKYQFLGLEIAEMLRDTKHKSLYIKLVKEHEKKDLFGLAKTIAGNKKIKNKGAYFMRVFHEELKLNKK